MTDTTHTCGPGCPDDCIWAKAARPPTREPVTLEQLAASIAAVAQGVARVERALGSDEPSSEVAELLNLVEETRLERDAANERAGETERDLQALHEALGVSPDSADPDADATAAAERLRGQVTSAHAALNDNFVRDDEEPPATLAEAVNRAIAHHAEHHAADRLEFRPAYKAMLETSSRRLQLLRRAAALFAATYEEKDPLQEIQSWGDGTPRDSSCDHCHQVGSNEHFDGCPWMTGRTLLAALLAEPGFASPSPAPPAVGDPSCCVAAPCGRPGCSRCDDDFAGRAARRMSLERAIADVGAQARTCAAKFRPFAGAHEAYGIIEEERAELLDEVRRKDDDPERPAGLRRELLDIAAAATRAAAELGGEGPADG